MLGAKLGNEVNQWLDNRQTNINDNYSKMQYGFTNNTYGPIKPNQSIYNAVYNVNHAKNHASPLALDLDNDGIETTHQSQGVFFDIKNTLAFCGSGNHQLGCVNSVCC